MRTTASYELFPDAPSERAMARARYLVREGRVADAEKAYRDLLAEHPDLKPGWAECFELLRSQGRTEDALRLAEGARAQFGDSAFSLALKGVALIELTRYRDALATLEQAVEFDPDLALVWHELGYAAFRLGDRNRALLALDRAFALEPHTETLRLRGRILRDAGRYQAAEVAYEGAALGVWRTMADALGAPLVTRSGFDPAACPLVVAQRPQPADSGWSTLTAAVAEHATGLVFVLEHLPEPAATGADVIGVLADAAGRRSRQANVPHALSEAQHPAGRLANRRLVRQ